MEMMASNRYSSLTRRAVATFIDGLLLAIPGAIVARVFPYFGPVLLFLLYAPVFECSMLQGTLGKYAMGIRVQDTGGHRLSFLSALIRNLVKSFSSVLLFIGWIVALFTERKQALHDLLVDSVVVYGTSSVRPTEAWESSVREIVQGMPNVTPKKSGAPDSVVAMLERLQALREKGAITESEFAAQKEEILRGGK